MDMTVRQIADELGVSRQKVYRYIKTNNPPHHFKGSGKTMYFGEAEIREMRRALGVGTPVESGAAADAPTEAGEEKAADSSGSDGLRERISELERENRFLTAETDYRMERVNELTKQRDELLKALKSSNECICRLTDSVRSLTENLRVSQLMHAETIKKLETAHTRSGRGRSARKSSRISITDLIIRLLGKK